MRCQATSAITFHPDHPRLADVRGLDAYAYRDAARTPGTLTGELVKSWTPLYRNEFRGITENGTRRPDVHQLEPARPGEEAPVAEMVAAARELLAAVDEESRARITFPVDAAEWQSGRTRSSCGSTPACGWSSNHRRYGRLRSR